MDKEKKVTISIEGAGLKYKGEVQLALAGQILNLCLNSQDLPIQSAEEVQDIPTKINKKESAAEYINRFIAKRNPDKILALAGFLRDSYEKELFHPNEIKVLFREAGEPLPANFGRDFRWAVIAGWIAQDSTKKDLYYITNTGIRVLKEGFPEELVKKTKNKMPYGRKNKPNNNGRG